MTRVLSLIVVLSWAATARAQEAEESMLSQVENAIVEKTNAFRQEYDLPAVKVEDHLSEAAKKFASFMAASEKYGHRADGKTPAQRAEAAGYEYCVVRENIAYRLNTGEVTAEGLTDVFVEGWKDSPSHRESMLADFVTQIGVGVATEDDETYYAVQLFGRPKSEAIKIKVRNESGEAKTLIVEANDGSDEIEMPSRTIITMTRCFPVTMRLSGNDDTMKLEESAELQITDNGLQKQQ